MSEMADSRLLDYVYENRRLPLFQRNPRLDIAKYDFHVDFDVPIGPTKCIIGGRRFTTLRDYPFFIHPYAHDHHIFNMIGQLGALINTAIYREKILLARFNQPTDQHSFIVKIEMETKRKRVDLENLFRSHRPLMDHMAYVEVLNDRLKMFAKYKKMTDEVTLDRRFVKDCDSKLANYARWLENEYGLGVHHAFSVFWNSCSLIDKFACSIFLNRNAKSTADLFYYMNEWNKLQLCYQV